MNQPPARWPAAGAPAAAYPPAYPQLYPSAYPQPYYGYYPGYAAPPQPPAPPTPAERASRPGVARLRSRILAIAFSALTVAAIVLGTGAALLGQSVPAPTAGRFQPVYDQALTTEDTTNWGLGAGCVFEGGGLHATTSSAGTSCAFQPSTKTDLLSQGFYLSTTLAPAGQIAGEEAAVIALATVDNTVIELRFSQDGSYSFSQPRSDGSTVTHTGVTIAWHADSYEANTVTVRYGSDTQALTAYVNGQNVFTENIQIPQGTALALGAPSDAEALFTHFTLYGGTPAASISRRNG
ncbi:MAG TPA: hypothetical protein VGN32_08835 [Ktedonobacterales bacterium]|nr:hypothetical protein [Ktedonobacterales bacterium]